MKIAFLFRFFVSRRCIYFVIFVQACRSAAELVDESARYGDICAEFAKHVMFAQQVN